MRRLCPLGRQRLIVVLDRSGGIQPQSKLVSPPKLETRFRKCVVANLSGWVTFRQVSRMCSDLVRDDAFSNIVSIGKPQMLFWGHITKHRTTVPADLCRPNPRSEMVISGSNIGRQRTQRVKRSLVTPLDLFLHILLNQVHRNVTGPFVHHLAAFSPSPLGQFALHL